MLQFRFMDTLIEWLKLAGLAILAVIFFSFCKSLGSPAGFLVFMVVGVLVALAFHKNKSQH